MAEFPYYDLVPKDFEENLDFRKYCIREGRNDPKAAEELCIMASRDALFYINTFVFTHDPRTKLKTLPFITYDFQDDAVVSLLDAIGKKDVLVEKSRDTGASWINLTTLEWMWHFGYQSQFLLGSRNADYVDKKGNPKALFWKLDFILHNLPAWMLPNYDRKMMHLGNNTTGSTIDGETTTGDFARGGRWLAILLDEFAALEMQDGFNVLHSTQNATNTRIFNSTPQGNNNAFAQMAKNPAVEKLRFHWSMIPSRAQGLYQFFQGELKIYDEDYVFPIDYPFVLDGKLRSPWYDNECTRADYPQLIAQELDIDYLGSAFQYFDQNELNKIQDTTVCDPMVVGDINYDHTNGTPDAKDPFREEMGGKFNLWMYLGPNGKVITDHRYVVGVDVATGSGSSNSTMSIWDTISVEKVGEYANSHIAPYEFARLAVATCRWLNNAFLIYEANGPGGPFGKEVLTLGYPNIHYRRQEDSSRARATDRPGWYSTKETKQLLFSKFKKMIEGPAIIRSRQTVMEARDYIYTPDSQIVHSKSLTTVDPTGARENHGDMVIADALGVYILAADIPDEKQDPEVPYGSFLYRQNMSRANEREDEYASVSGW